MTIDEAIKHWEEKTEALYKAIPCDGCAFNECVKEHKQLAEWLKRLVIISNAKVEIIRRIEDAKSKDKLCEYPYIRCIDIVKEVFGDDSKRID